MPTLFFSIENKLGSPQAFSPATDPLTLPLVIPWAPITCQAFSHNSFLQILLRLEGGYHYPVCRWNDWGSGDLSDLPERVRGRIRTQVYLAPKPFPLWSALCVCSTGLCQAGQGHVRERNCFFFSPQQQHANHPATYLIIAICSAQTRFPLFVQFLSSKFSFLKCEQRLQMHGQTVRIKLIKICSLQCRWKHAFWTKVQEN